MEHVSTTSIAKQIAALDATVAELEAEADEKSIAAVSGDKAVASELVRISATIDRALRDRDLLLRARKRSARAERKAAEKAEKAERQAHIEAARAHAQKLHAIAERADKLVADFGSLTAEMRAAEQAAHRELGHAKFHAPGQVPGRHGLSVEAFKHMNNVEARGDFATKRSLADIALRAWGFLIVTEAGNDDI